MEIKSIQEMYPYRSSMNSLGRKVKGISETAPVSREIGTEGDVVKISPEASFRVKLESVTKNYATENQIKEAAIEKRVEALKEKYKGDSCPVSGYEVSRAVMNMVMGEQR